MSGIVVTYIHTVLLTTAHFQFFAKHIFDQGFHIDDTIFELKADISGIGHFHY